jgi:hypothetical protein
MRYEAKLDWLAKAITIGVMALLGAVACSSVVTYFAAHTFADFVPVAISVIIPAVIYLFKPNYYTIDEHALSVYRPKGTFTMPLENIKSIERLSSKQLGWGMRLFASGGFFGYLGLFYYGSIGSVMLYCTNRSEMLLVTTEKRPFIISPENSDDFLAEWKRKKQDQF